MRQSIAPKLRLAITVRKGRNQNLDPPSENSSSRLDFSSWLHAC